MNQADTIRDRVDGADLSVHVNGHEITVNNVTTAVCSGLIDLDALPDRERDVMLQMSEVARRRSDAAVTLIAESAHRTGSHRSDGHTSVRGWGRALCHWSNHQVRTTVSIVKLIADHPRCRDAYVGGRLGLAQAVELARLANHPRAGQNFADSEELLLEDAMHLSYDDFKTVTARWLLLADPDGANQDEKLKHYLRNGCVITDREGMVHIDAQFAGAQGAMIKEIFDRFYQTETQADFDAARAEAGDDQRVTKSDLPRTDEQRRADAIHTIFTRAGSTPPGSRAPEPLVNIMCDLETFEDLVNHQPGDGPVDPASYRTRRCETADGNPVAPDDLIAAALIGWVRRIVTDSRSTIIDKGTRQRLFTGSAREAAQLQYPRCTYPGCGVPTKHTQIDHIIPARDGGPTAPWNGNPNCPHHNRWKELGYHTWHDPNGHWHTLRPDGTPITHV